MAGSLVLLAALGAVATAAGVVTGGWAKREVTEEAAQLLQSALARMDAQEGPPLTRVSVVEILALETQVVSGTNYRFTVAGRGVSSASGDAGEANDSLPVERFVVRVYEQPWTNTLRVTDVSVVRDTGDEL